ncbi:MAG: glycoside hydrolase family 16 protein [Candidatus Cryptobacteroides sp.]|nr:glycoside hydrolase family 16 protein [Candidatus Cryptobacteroides sp.]
MIRTNMNLFAALASLALSISSCGFSPVQKEDNGTPAIQLGLVSVEDRSITVDVAVSGTDKINFTYVQCTQLSTGESKTEILPDPKEGRVTVSALAKGETYELCAFADIPDNDSPIGSDKLTVTTGKAVTVSVTRREGAEMDVKLTVNIPKTPVMKGFTYKKQSGPEDPVYVIVEGDRTEYTLKGIEQYSTYLVKGFADFGDGYQWSDELVVSAPPREDIGDYKLVFSAEFDQDNEDLTKVWSFEEGSKIRNDEDQFYSKSKENAFTKDGFLHIVARRNHLGSDGITHSYTSASLTTQHSFVYCYGKVEVRAKIPTGGGMWPAIWQVGNTYIWPQNGELDIMEYYREKIMANVAYGGTANYSPTWRSSSHPMSGFEAKNPNWRNEFHIWLLEWDYDWIRIYLDGELLNQVSVNETVNKGVDGNYENPYRYHRPGFGHYLWLNLAIGGNNGGTIDNSLFPAEYLIDYVRVYQKERLPK